MKKYAFISRHEPTPEQISLAADAGIELVAVGDRDAFTLNPREFADSGEWSGVVVVHPAAALRCIPHLPVAIFENGSRPVEGGKPQFFAVALHRFVGLTTCTDDSHIDVDPLSQSCPIIQHNGQSIGAGAI